MNEWIIYFVACKSHIVRLRRVDQAWLGCDLTNDLGFSSLENKLT